MDQKLKELFHSYASKPDSMKQKEFEKLLDEKKICDKKEAGKIYGRYCIMNNLSFDSFKFSLKEIAIKKQIDEEKIIKIILGISEEEELKELEEKKKEIIKRQENLKQNVNIKPEEKVKEIVKDMCVLGDIMKKEIIKEKKNNPEKFISIEEAIKDEKKDGGVNFCLGVMAQNLESIGITTAIEKEINNSEESMKASETVLQFIMNGMVDKKKFDLHFDFGPKRNNEILNNKIEQEKFHTELRKNISKGCNIPEDQILFGNPEKGSAIIKVIIMNDELKNFGINELKNKCKNVYDFKYLKEVRKTLIMGGCKLNKNMLDPAGNRFSGWPDGEERGGLPYYSPKGWMGFGLKVTGKYDKGNDDWLAANGNKNEWAVAYHGVGSSNATDLEQAVGNIAKSGYKVGEGQAYRNSINGNRPGQKVGIGIYCSPSPDVLKQYANYSKTSTVIQGKNYIMGFMMRVKPDKIRYPVEKPDYWVLNATPDEMRPYRILVKEKENK